MSDDFISRSICEVNAALFVAFSELFKNRMGLLEVGDQRMIGFRDSLENDGPDGAIVHLPATMGIGVHARIRTRQTPV